jgi:predicted ATPase
VLAGLWRFYFQRAELQTACELGEQLLSLAQKVQDPALLLEAHRTLGPTLSFLGEWIPARVHLEQGIRLYDRQQHRSHAFLYGLDPGVVCLSVTALALWHLGYPDQALRRNQEALSLAQELSHPYSLAYALSLSAQLHQSRWDGPLTQEWAEATITVCTEQGFPYWLAQGTIFRGWALAEQGQRGEGMAQLREGLAAYQALGAELIRPYHLALLAEAAGKGGQAEEGAKVLIEALAIVDKTGERRWEAELYRLKGALTLQQANQKAKGKNQKSKVETNPQPLAPNPQEEVEQEAEGYFLKAIKIARHQQAKSLELRATMSLARLWQSQGKKTESHQILAEIYGWFTEGFDTADLQEAKKLLEALETP